jgi:hypothetical protein
VRAGHEVTANWNSVEAGKWSASRPEPEDAPEPGLCWVCERPYGDVATAFDDDGEHGRCRVKAQRIDAGLRGRRDEPLNLMTVVW